MNSKAGVMILGLGWAVASCRREPPPGPTGPVVEQRGDTTVVSTRGDGKWGPPREAKPLLRIMGPGGTQTFGEIYQIAVLPNGHLLAFDSKGTSGPALLEFGEDGRFIKKIGRDGSGPGEYSAGMTLSVAPDGTILAAEREMNRASRFRMDGTYSGSFHLPMAANVIELGPNGTLSLIVQTARKGAGPKQFVPNWSYVRIDTAGRFLDSTRIVSWASPDRETSNEFGSLRESWVPHPFGGIVQVRPDVAGFLLVGQPGRRGPLLGRLETAAPRYLPEERREIQAFLDGMSERGPKSTRKVDETKELCYPINAAGPDLSGRIWIRRRTEAVKVDPYILRIGEKSDTSFASYAEPPVFLAFDTDGTFLGEIRFPVGGTRAAFYENVAWMVETNEAGEPIVVKYQIY